MISGWNQRLASRSGWASLLTLTVILAFGMADRARGAGPKPAPVLLGPDPAPGAISQWVQEDRIWLASKVGTAAAVLGDTLGLSWLEIDRMLPPAPEGTGRRDPASLLRDRWLDRGFLEVQISVRPGSNPDQADTLAVAPGERWTYASITVEGDPFPGRDRLLETWLPRPGQPMNAGAVDEAVDRILAWAGETGYPFARWVTRSIELDPTSRQAAVTAALLPGQRARVGRVTSDLPPGPGARFLVRATGLRSGGIYSEEELDRALERLVARDLYARVDPPRVYLTSSPDSVGIHFPVVPRRKVNRLQVVLGLSRGDQTGGSRLSGQVELALPNMAGSGRSLQAGWRDDGDLTSRFGLTYLEPLLLSTPLDLELALDQEVQRDVFTRFRIDTTWRLPVVALWGVDLVGGWDRATYPAGALESTSRLRAGVGVAHRRGDRSRSGWRGLFGLESGWRSSTRRPLDPDDDSTESGGLGASTFQKILKGNLDAEIWVTPTLSLAGRVAFRQQTGGEAVVPMAEQFRFGGASTVRGYNEEEFHGHRTGWGGIELRVGRAGSSRLYTFYDLGYFEFWSLEQDAVVLLTGRPRGYGLGLLARTRGGDLSLAIGFPGTVDFDQAKLHVTLLESF